MLATTHVLVGSLSAVGMAAAGHLEMSAVNIAAAALGSLLPDIDHTKSAVGRRLLPLSMLVSSIFGHRGITHSLLAVIGLGFALAFYAPSMPEWAVAIIIGYLSHLAADWLTPYGVPLLWPKRKTFSARESLGFSIQTGSVGESAFAAALAIGGALWFLR